MRGLTDIAGIKVGHASDFDGLTGCTVVLCEGGAVGGVDIRGSATGTQEMDVLSPLHATQRIHAVCLAGGSAFGLEAASGVRRFLEQKGIGVQTRGGRVPLVPSAILYDLAFGKKGARPTREMGLAAAAAATSEAVVEGNIGAGLGATVGKLFGPERAMKSGIGSATVNLTGRWAGVMVSALAVVNAFGDVLDPKTGQVLAGARESAASSKFVGTADALLRGDGAPPPLSNTTLVVVATNARLSKVEATKLAQLGQHGMVRTISPVHTAYDGDLVIALSVGDRAVDVNALGVAAGMAVAQAIERGVRLAKPLGGLPGLG